MSELTDLAPFEEKVQRGEKLSHEDALSLFVGVQRERAVKEYSWRRYTEIKSGLAELEQLKFWQRAAAETKQDLRSLYQLLELALDDFDNTASKDRVSWKSAATGLASTVQFALNEYSNVTITECVQTVGGKT